MKKKVLKFFRRLLARCQRAFKRVKRFFSRKRERTILETDSDDPIFHLFPEEFTRDTYTPDPARKLPETKKNKKKS